jgi:hypothetical protein
MLSSTLIAARHVHAALSPSVLAVLAVMTAVDGLRGKCSCALRRMTGARCMTRGMLQMQSGACSLHAGVRCFLHRELCNLRAELGHASGLLEQRAWRLDSGTYR